jgi:hypothetical protein
VAARKTRKTQTRRDRRKAKESNWQREGKTKNSKIGHGNSGQPLRQVNIQGKNIYVGETPVKLLNSKLTYKLKIGDIPDKPPEELTDDELAAFLDVVDWAYSEKDE